MGTWVEINDGDAAIAAGDRFMALGSEVSATEPPPVDWGDDEFGDRMRSQYPDETVEDIREAKAEVRRHLRKSGSGVRWAVNTVTEQDVEEGRVFTEITPPEV